MNENIFNIINKLYSKVGFLKNTAVHYGQQ